MTNSTALQSDDLILDQFSAELNEFSAQEKKSLEKIEALRAEIQKETRNLEKIRKDNIDFIKSIYTRKQ